jgi:hypothetical protein
MPCCLGGAASLFWEVDRPLRSTKPTLFSLLKKTDL